MGDLPEPVDHFDLVDRVDRRREAAVDAEDLVVDDDGEGEEVEHVGEVLPHVGGSVLSHALGVEPVRLRHRPGLVVAPDQMDPFRVPELEADEQ